MAVQKDFGFVGPAYTAADPYQSRQLLINYYLEATKVPGVKTPTALLGAPGLIQVASAVGL